MTTQREEPNAFVQRILESIRGRGTSRLEQGLEAVGEVTEGVLKGIERPFRKPIESLARRQGKFTEGRDMFAPETGLEALASAPFVFDWRTASPLEVAATAAPAAGLGRPLFTAGAGIWAKAAVAGRIAETVADARPQGALAGARGGFRLPKLGAKVPPAVETPPTGLPPGSFDGARQKLIAVLRGTPASKGVRGVKGAWAAQKETQALYHQRRQEQAAVLRDIFSKGGGEETLNKALGSLKGPLPKASFEPPKGLMTPEESAALYSQIWVSPEIRDFQRVAAGEAFRNLFSSGVAPTRSELLLLERVYGNDFVQTILDMRSQTQKVWEEIVGVLGVPRALKSSFDLSAPFRQGALLVGQPKEFGGAFKDMFTALKSDASLAALDDAIRNDPFFELADESGLYIAPTGGRAATLSQQEEAYATSTPIASKILKMMGVNISQRGYVGFLNSLRARTFYSYAKQWGNRASPEDYRKLAQFINAASGRGNLGRLEKVAPELAQVFFSPRYFMSRLQAPMSLASGDMFRAGPSVGRVAAKNLVAFMGANIGLLSLVNASGAATVNLDPRSPDFGKAKFGNTRVDFFASYSQLARFTAMLMTQQGVSGRTGKEYDSNWAETILSFGRTKLAPLPGAGVDIAVGEDLTGKEITWDGRGILDQAGNLVVPMNAEAIKEAVEEHGAPGALFGGLSTFGAGVNTYSSKIADLHNQWQDIVEGYESLPSNTNEAKRLDLPTRAQYREANPEDDARLFLLGYTESFRTDEAQEIAARLAFEAGLKSSDIQGLQPGKNEGIDDFASKKRLQQYFAIILDEEEPVAAAS